MKAWGTWTRRIIWGTLLVASLRGAMAGATPEIVRPDAGKLLVLDRRVLASTENARIRLGSPVKEAKNPLLRSDQPWENATNNYYPNVLWDAESGLWKVWYKDVLADPDAIAKMDGPSTVHDVGWYLLFARSADGLAWDRPELGLHRFEGRGGNNIVARDCPNVGVFRDEQDPDPERRYKMVYDVGLGQPRVRFSPDGIHWGVERNVKGFLARQGDTHNNAFWDERLGKYLWFTKLYLGERLVTRLESPDFEHWTSSGVVLRSTLDEGKAHQTYALTVFPYANLWLGYLMMYHVGTGRTVDVELAWSPDSVHWERVAPGQSFLPLGSPGSYDGGCIYAQAGPPVVQDGKLQIYYGGSPTVHLGWKRSADLCLARLRMDGFASLESVDGTRPALAVTNPLRPVPGRPMRLLADGPVSSEAVEEADGTRRLRVTIPPGAHVYGIEGAELVTTALPPLPTPEVPQFPVARGPVIVSFDEGPDGWTGVDGLTHHAEGFVRISRKAPQRPIAKGTPLAGDWPVLFGGDRLEISARVRGEGTGGRVQLEVFARDLAAWSYDGLPEWSAEWQTMRAELRYDWTDEEAMAAGWTRSALGFSWRETVRHAGLVVLVASEVGGQDRFDLDEVRLTPW